MSMPAKCITCPEFRKLCEGALAVIVEWRIDVGTVTVERLIGVDVSKPGDWELCQPEDEQG